ncbi:MAG TPA: hypothetical protein VFZ00_06435 [Solirubrobacter sp.]|jgi:hypothetical protein|nr:hypothetical protein [Solirubrobacter sp.]
MTGGFPHHHLHRDADHEPDLEPRPYKITVLLDEVSEADAVEIAREMADVLAARGIAILEADDTVRSAIGIEPAVWPESLGLALEGDLAGAAHIVVPKAVPQPPDLGLGYSPN